MLLQLHVDPIASLLSYKLLISGLSNTGDNCRLLRVDLDSLSGAFDLQQSGDEAMVRSLLFIFRKNLYLF